MSIAITGATGQLGRLAIAALKARGAQPIALARDPAKAADMNVETRAFDYTSADPAALKGIVTLVLISSNDLTDRVAQHKSAIAAAKAAGVTRIVYTSLLKGAANQMQLSLDHAPTEAALIESGIAYTILRNGWYTENYTGGIGAALSRGVLFGSAGKVRISSAARADYADAAAVVLATDGHDGAIYELAGDTSWTLADLAAEVSRQSGTPVNYKDLPPEAYVETLTDAGLPAALAAAVAGWDADVSKGALYEDGKALSALIGRPTASLEAAVEEELAGVRPPR